MSRPSTLEDHPQRKQIIDAIVKKQPYRIILSWANPPISMAAIGRFKQRALAELSAKPKTQAARTAFPSQNTAIEVPQPAQTVADNGYRQSLTSLASPFRSRLESTWGIAERTLARAEAAVRVVSVDGESVPVGADLSCVAPLLAQAHRNIELLGRATGELEQAQSQNNTQINIMLDIPR